MRWWGRFLPLVLLTLVVLPSAASAESKNLRADEHQKRPNEQANVIEQRQPGPSVPVRDTELSSALGALHSEQEARAKEEHAEDEGWHAPSVLVQIGLLIIGSCYTLFARRQWLAIKRQTELIEESLIADKRAFVCADGLYYFWEAIENTTLYNFRLSPVYRNTGSTPTKNLRSHVECDIRNTVLPPNHVFFDQNQEVGSGMIPPNGQNGGGRAPQNTPISPFDILEAQALRRFIYLWGWIKYRDVFPNTPEHTTHFCWLIQVIGNPMAFVPNTVGQAPTPGALDFRFLQHNEGNDAD
jgi:hypothetical protein